VDPKWKSDTEALFHGMLRDKSQGEESVHMPETENFEPGGYYNQKAKLYLETGHADDGTEIILTVKDAARNVVVQKTFPKLQNPTDPTVPFLGPKNVPLGEDDPALGQKRSDGNVDRGNAACGAAFKQARHWNGQEDMFVYTTDIDVKSLQANCAFPADGLVYATRTDARENGALDNTGKYSPDNPKGYEEDPDRLPFGYRLENGATLDKPLMFVSNDPVWIRGISTSTSTNGAETRFRYRIPTGTGRRISMMERTTIPLRTSGSRQPL